MNDYIYRLLIAKAGITPNATGLADLEDGELLVVDGNFAVVTAADTVDDAPGLYIVQGTPTGTPPKMSTRIQGRNITKFKGASYAAAAQQVSYIGYNTTAGAINAANSTAYSLTIVFKHNKELWSKRPALRTYSYTSTASATQAEIATALVALMNADAEFARQAVAAVTSTGSDRGIRITGLAQTKNYIDDYQIVNFELSINLGFDGTVGVDQYGYIETNGSKTTTNSTSVKPDPGVGTAALIEDLERRAQGFSGVTNLIKFPVPNYPIYTVAGGTYDLYVIEHFDRHESKDLTAKRDFPLITIIAVEASNTAMTTYIESILNPYVASVGLPAVTL
jgi:hypothetical protein